MTPNIKNLNAPSAPAQEKKEPVLSQSRFSATLSYKEKKVSILNNCKIRPN